MRDDGSQFDKHARREAALYEEILASSSGPKRSAQVVDNGQGYVVEETLCKAIGLNGMANRMSATYHR